MESDWSIERITGISVVENPGNDVLKSYLKDYGRWLLVIVTKGSLTYRRDKKDRKLGPGLVLIPTPRGYENLIADDSFRGRLLMLPSYHVMSMNSDENLSLHLSAHKDPFRKIAPSDSAIMRNYYSIFANLAPINCVTYSVHEMMHLSQALLMFLKKFYL